MKGRQTQIQQWLIFLIWVLKKCVNEYMNFYFQLIKDVSTLGRYAAER